MWLVEISLKLEMGKRINPPFDALEKKTCCLTVLKVCKALFLKDMIRLALFEQNHESVFLCWPRVVQKKKTKFCINLRIYCVSVKG